MERDPAGRVTVAEALAHSGGDRTRLHPVDMNTVLVLNQPGMIPGQRRNTRRK